MDRSHATSSISRATNEDVERSSEAFSPEVDAFERTFQKIQNNYIHSVGSNESVKDYKDRMKVQLSLLWTHCGAVFN